MWKQMDSTVDGIVDRVVTGARVMKSMIGDYMPSKQPGGNVMDYLPTETTRIKYIIRNPHTKETKVIRVRPSKKVVKLMAMTPKPLMQEKPKAIPMLDPEKLRQLEREQELIAEGRFPKRDEKKSSYSTIRSEKYSHTKNDDQYVTHDNEEIISSKIKEFNESWKPVYKLGDPPAGFTTSKPIMMSALHTSVVGEFLPKPQKQVYEPLVSNDFPEEEPKKTHTYEVTEYTAEESVVQPYEHDYYNIRNQPVTNQVTSSLERESFTKYSSVTTESPNTITQIENDIDLKLQRAEYRAQRGFLPSRGNYRSNGDTTTTTTSTSTTTTEEPNYPAIFLRKYRNRPDTVYNPKEHLLNKSTDLSHESSNWIPSNATYSSQKGRSTAYHIGLINASQKTKSQKWPPDLENTFLNSSPVKSQYEVSSTTETTHLQDLTTESIRNTNSRKNVRLKTDQYSSDTSLKYKSFRQRGSIKYGDKLLVD